MFAPMPVSSERNSRGPALLESLIAAHIQQLVVPRLAR